MRASRIFVDLYNVDQIAAMAARAGEASFTAVAARTSHAPTFGDLYLPPAHMAADQYQRRYAGGR